MSDYCVVFELSFEDEKPTGKLKFDKFTYSVFSKSKRPLVFLYNSPKLEVHKKHRTAYLNTMLDDYILPTRGQDSGLRLSTKDYLWNNHVFF